MIDITVGNNEIWIDSQLYHSFNSPERGAALIWDLIEKILYSGESISLWQVEGESKKLLQEWVNPHVSNRYNRRYEHEHPRSTR